MRTSSPATRFRSTPPPRPYTTTNYTVGYTHTLTPNLVNDFRVGRNFFNTATLNPFAVSGQTTAGTDLGIPGFNGDTTFNNPGHSGLQYHGLQRAGQCLAPTGTRTTAPCSSPNRSAGTTARTTSWPGLEFRRLATGRAAVNSPRGAFTFNGTLTGYAPADFILGLPQTFTTPGPEVRGRVAEWRDGFFVLDKWQVSRKLTLNYGLRYELPTVAYTINGNATELNPNQTAIVGGTPGFHFTDPNHNDWAPRLGFAYRINGQDGIPRRRRHLLQSEPDQQLHVPEHQSALHDDSTCTWSAGLTSARLSNPVRSAGVCPTAPTAGTDRDRPLASATGRMNQWSAGLERQLWSGGGFEAAVSGLAFLSPGPQLLQQHAAVPRTGLGQLAPAESAVRPDPHHQHR